MTMFRLSMLDVEFLVIVTGDDMKTCFKCNVEKPLSDFYEHHAMADGRLNKCKECTKRDVIRNRAANHDYYIAYDNERSKLPHRKKARRDYCPEFRKNNPEKYAAHKAVQCALRRGDLVKLPCIICGSDSVEAHHPDYSRPLDVVWLCVLHHRQTHAMSLAA